MAQDPLSINVIAPVAKAAVALPKGDSGVIEGPSFEATLVEIMPEEAVLPDIVPVPETARPLPAAPGAEVTVIAEEAALPAAEVNVPLPVAADPRAADPRAADPSKPVERAAPRAQPSAAAASILMARSQPAPSVPIPTEAAVSPRTEPVPVPRPDTAVAPVAAADPVMPKVIPPPATVVQTAGEARAGTSDGQSREGSSRDGSDTRARSVGGPAGPVATAAPGFDPAALLGFASGLVTDLPLSAGSAVPLTSGEMPAVTTSSGTPVPTMGAHPSALIPHVARQLASAVTFASDKAAEIRLDPAELGKVRITIETDDSAVTMVIQAERPETLDLMRRNIDQMTQEFRAMGYQDIAFRFGGDRRGDGGQERASGQPASPADALRTAPDEIAPAVRPGLTLAGTLDLRL